MKVEVLCRDSWGAVPSAGTLRPHKIRELTVHHTAVELRAATDAPGRVRSFQRGHIEDGFVDLAYHYVIDGQGHIYEARSTDIPGETYTAYDPDGHFLAVCDGNFEVQPVPSAQFDALARLLAWASHHFEVAPTTLRGHRDVAATACPGRNLYATLEDGSLRAAVDAHLSQGVPHLERICGDAGQARVQAISSGRA